MGLSKKNYKQLLIGKDVDRTSSVTPATLAEGEIALFTPSGTLITSANAASFDKAVVFKGTASGQPVQLSDVITKAKVKTAVGKNGVAAQEQITYVGYNGSEGSIDVINDNWFFVKLAFQELLVSNTDGRVIKHGQYKTAVSGATQEKIAVGLQKSLINNFSREPQDTIKAELVNSGTKTALGTGVNNVVFTKGSDVVTAEDIDDSTTNAALAVGELIGVGDVYAKIISIDASNNFVKLATPWQGATQTVADTGVDRITVANYGDFGIKITGVALSATPGKFIPAKVTWDTVLDGFTDTVATKSQASSVGVNTAELVAEAEFFYQGDQGETFRFNPLAHPMRAEAENVLYDSIDIRWVEDVLVGSQYQVPEKELSVLIPATRSNDQYSAATSGIKAAFDAFFGITLSL